MSSQYNFPDKQTISKRNLRAEMRDLRKQLSADYRQEQSHLIVANLAPLLDSVPAQTIGMYLATAFEVNLDSVINTCHQNGKTIYLPHLEDPQTPFRQFLSWDSLESGPLDLRHPPKSAPSIATSSLDVIILPGLAFDRLGNRLGHGGGWYDKAIGDTNMPVKEQLLIGVCFEEQLVASVPHESFDVRMDIVVTPLGISN